MKIQGHRKRYIETGFKNSRRILRPSCCSKEAERWHDRRSLSSSSGDSQSTMAHGRDDHIYSKATLSAKYKTAGYPDKKLLDAAVTGGS